MFNLNEKIFNIIFGAIISAIIIVPFAIPYAYFPLSKFYSELFTLVCAVLLFLLTVLFKKELRVPIISIGSFLFAIYMLIQPFFVEMWFPGNNSYVALLFVIAGLTGIAVSTTIYGEENGFDRVLAIICWSLVVSALLQSCIAFLQYIGHAEGNSLILYTPDVTHDGVNIFGNLGQPNQFVDFISLGVVAITYLAYTKRVYFPLYIVYAIIYASVITFTGRRGVFAYYLVMLVTIAYVYLRNLSNKDLAKKYQKSLLYIAGFFVGLIIVQMLMPHIVEMLKPSAAGGAAAENMVTGVSRFSSDSIGQSTYRRFYEWFKCVILFFQHPIFGIGWYNYSHYGIDIMNSELFSHIPQNSKLYTHSHNSFLNTLAEGGLIGFGILIVYGLGFSFWSLARKVNKVKSLFVILLTIPILTHSALEYPLWYAYFFIILIILLSFAPTKYAINIDTKLGDVRLIKPLQIIGVACCFALVSFGYTTIDINNKLMYLAQSPQTKNEYYQKINMLEGMVDDNSMFSMAAATVLDNYVDPTNELTQKTIPMSDQLKYINKLANELPYPSALFKQMIVNKMAGNDEKSLQIARTIAHAYPYYKDQFAAQLKRVPAFAAEYKVLDSFKYSYVKTFGIF